MNRVLLDTAGFLALWNARDQWHEAALDSLTKLTALGVDFVTTNLIRMECGNAAARTSFRSEVVEAREQFLIDGKLLEPSDAEYKAAWDAFARGEAADAGIVDHVSFIVMRRLNITDAFTNDRHFKAAGFHTLF